MKKVKTFLEIGTDGRFGVYVDLKENSLNYGIFGEGATQEEAVQDFFQSYQDMKQIYQRDGEYFVEAEFSVEVDILSFLRYYSNFITLEGLERFTGIKKKQLSDYINDRKTPTAPTIEKIKNGFKKLQEELQTWELAF